MLRPIEPPDAKSISEQKKLTGYFAKLTGEKGDIKFFKSTGKAERTFMRVWVGEGAKVGGDTTGPQWYEVIAATTDGGTPLDTK